VNDQLVHRSSTDTRPVRQQNCPKSRETVKKRKMCNTWLGRRGNFLRDSVEPRLETDNDDRPWNRVQGSGITMAGQPTASNGWRLGLRHGRHDRRQATTSERQRLVRQEEAATKLSHSRRRYDKDVRPTHSLRRSVLNSTARHVNGDASARPPTTPVDTQSAVAHTRTAARQLARPATPTHTRTRSPTTSTHDYWATVIHPRSSASGAQF